MKSLALEKMAKAREEFTKKTEIAEVESLMRKITLVVNNLALGNLPDSPAGTKGNGFNVLTGEELSEYQMRLSGYKFYLADMVAEMMSKSQYLNAYADDYRARNWHRVSDEIIQRDGKVKNREMIENEMLKELATDIEERIFYETEYQRLRLKSLALESILTAIVQRVAELKRQIEQSKM